jgi:hypothetical protein
MGKPRDQEIGRRSWVSAMSEKTRLCQVAGCTHCGGFIKGKSAIHIARHFGERRRNFVGQHFWARGYFVSTVGRDETVIRQYIRRQEIEDQRVDQLKLG